MPTIGQKSNQIEGFCGHFVTTEGDYVGVLVKVAKGQYVIVGLKEWASTVEWISGVFTAKEIKKHSFCPAWQVNNYTAA